MNFLAHIFLSAHDDHLMVGNFIADSITKKEEATYPATIRNGILMHYGIDNFTDSHPSVRESNRRLRDQHSKYAPVILDVLHDFLLIKNWGNYTSAPLSDFTTEVYAKLEAHHELMPHVLRDRLPRMIADNWLEKYGTEAGLKFTFSRLQMKASKPHLLENATDSLFRHLDFLDDRFNAFFPDLQAFAKEFRAEEITE